MRFLFDPPEIDDVFFYGVCWIGAGTDTGIQIISRRLFSGIIDFQVWLDFLPDDLIQATNSGYGYFLLEDFFAKAG